MFFFPQPTLSKINLTWLIIQKKCCRKHHITLWILNRWDGTFMFWLIEGQHNICRRETNECFPNLSYIFTVSSFKSNRGIALKLMYLMWSNLIHYAVITVVRHSYIFHSWPCNKKVPRGYFLRLNCSSPSKCFQRLCHGEWQHCANLAEGASCTIRIFRNWMTALWLQMTHIAGNLELLK